MIIFDSEMRKAFSLTLAGCLFFASCSNKVTSLKTIAKADTAGTISTTIPVTQHRDKHYDWDKRHQQVLALNKERPPKVVFIGNSITHYWGGEPVDPLSRGADSWNEYFKPKDVRNLGFGWDRIENVLWRVYHGELDGYKASHITLLMGTNNLPVSTDNEIITGLEFLIQAIKRHQPKAKLMLISLLPRKKYEQRIVNLNERIRQLAEKLNVNYVPAHKSLAVDGGKPNPELFTADGVHPNAAGYRILAPLINSYLN